MSKVQPKAEAHSAEWHPWPWNILPGWVAFGAGVLILISAAPLLLSSIAILQVIYEIGWRVLQRLHITPSLGSWPQRIADRIMIDPRNASYLPKMLFLAIWPAIFFFWDMYRCATVGFEFRWWFLVHLITMGPRLHCFSWAQVLVHKEGHDHHGFFKGAFRVFNYLNQWWIGPFYGQVPMFYAISHVKQHHRYDGNATDTATSWDLDRSKASSYIKYVPRFLLTWTGVAVVVFFVRNKEYRLARKLLLGMIYYYSVMLALLCWNWRFALAHWVAPHFENIVFLSAISYLWHVFVDPDDVNNPYVSSLTVLNGRDNVWNEDYHVAHHACAALHWTDYPKHYEDNKHEFAARQATIFTDTEEGEIFGWIVTGRWRTLAEHFVDLTGKLTVEEKQALILRRLSYIVPLDVASASPATSAKSQKAKKM